MPYTGQQRFLLQAAKLYHNLGYKVAYCKGKEFLQRYELPEPVMTAWGPLHVTSDPESPDDFDGISLIPDGIVCVDIDIPDLGVIWDHQLPPTLKERTPRGWHLFYGVHDDKVHTSVPKIKWRPHVDLLVKDKQPNRKASPYGNKTNPKSPWGEHVLISPTSGYQRIWPDEVPKRDNLPDAPTWLLDALRKNP